MLWEGLHDTVFALLPASPLATSYPKLWCSQRALRLLSPPAFACAVLTAQNVLGQTPTHLLRAWALPSLDQVELVAFLVLEIPTHLLPFVLLSPMALHSKHPHRILHEGRHPQCLAQDSPPTRSRTKGKRIWGRGVSFNCCLYTGLGCGLVRPAGSLGFGGWDKKVLPLGLWDLVLWQLCDDHLSLCSLQISF